MQRWQSNFINRSTARRGGCCLQRLAYRSFGIGPLTEHQKCHAFRPRHNLALGGRPNTNQDAALHRLALTFCEKSATPIKRNIKLLLVIDGMVVLRVMLPMGWHPDGVHPNLRETETFDCKEKILTLLKRTSATFHLVESFDCNVWHKLMLGLDYTL